MFLPPGFHFFPQSRAVISSKAIQALRSTLGRAQRAAAHKHRCSPSQRARHCIEDEEIPLSWFFMHFGKTEGKYCKVNEVI